MTEQEKPPYVRVAEALGWKRTEPFEADGLYDYECWIGESPEPSRSLIFDKEFLPRFDTDWAKTGPLIERYGIELEYREPRRGASRWGASLGLVRVFGPTPLVAVCLLLETLGREGKL